MEAGSNGADVVDSEKRRREAREGGRAHVLMPSGLHQVPPSLAIIPVSAMGARSGLPPGSRGIYCTPSYYRGPVWADMNSLHAGSPMMQCKVVMPKSSLSSSEEIGDSLDGNTCKKPRTQFTPKQLMYLEDKFAEERFPTLKDREDMAKELDLTQMHIQIWFQNRRAKNRRQKKRVQVEELKQRNPSPPPFWPRHLSFNSNFTGARNDSYAKKTNNEQTSEPSNSTPRPASPTNEASLQSQARQSQPQSPPSTDCSKSISENTSNENFVYPRISQNGHDTINSSQFSVTTTAIITPSASAPLPVMSSSQNTAIVPEVYSVSVQSSTVVPINNGAHTPLLPSVQFTPVGYSSPIVNTSAPCTCPSPTSLRIDWNSPSTTKSIHFYSTITTPAAVSSLSPDQHQRLPPVGYTDTVVNQPTAALPVMSARQASILETLSSTAASLMAKAGAITTTACVGNDCINPTPVVSHRPASLALITSTLSAPMTNGVAPSDIMSGFEGVCNSNPVISSTCRRDSSDSSLSTPEGNSSLGSLSAGSEADFLSLPRHTDDLGPGFPLSGLTSPIFAEEPVALADILREECDLFDITPTREQCPLPAVDTVFPPPHQAYKVVQNHVSQPPQPPPARNYLHRLDPYNTPQSMEVQYRYCPAELQSSFHHATMSPQPPPPYSRSHYHHHHPYLRSSRNNHPHINSRPHYFAPESSVSIANHHSSSILFSSQ